MKILHVNYSDSRGGSAKAAYRLHRSLIAMGIQSKMLVKHKQRRDQQISGAANLPANLLRRVELVGDKLPLLAYPHRESILFSTQRMPNITAQRIRFMKPDIVNLHWVGHGMLRIESLVDLPQPLVWTLHDVWPVTGGCHVQLDCQNYRYSCGQCPQLGSVKPHDLSNRIWLKKRKAWREVPLTFVAPSRWMASVVQDSELLPKKTIEIIPIGVDTQIFHPADRLEARQMLGLPQNKRLILFGAASDGRHKGFSLLEQALAGLDPALRRQSELILFGPQKPAQPEDNSIAMRSMGSIEDEDKLALLYTAADITVVPSKQETFPLVAVESLACGTPVVAFAATGLLDIVDHEQNGYLAKPFEVEDLACGIAWTLERETRLSALAENGRTKVEREFDSKLQAERYLALYRELK